MVERSGTGPEAEDFDQFERAHVRRQEHGDEYDREYYARRSAAFVINRLLESCERTADITGLELRTVLLMELRPLAETDEQRRVIDGIIAGQVALTARDFNR